MSRFWAGDSSASDDSNASSSDYSSSDDSSAGGAAGNRWVALSESSDSSDDHGRVVKSGQQRALETFQSLIVQLVKSMKERDYYAIQTQFDELAKSMIKYKQYLADGVPKPLVKILVDLEDYIAERLQDKAQFQRLSARQGRALNRMKLTLKKHNKAYAVVIAEYKKNPIVGSPLEDEEESSSSSSSSSDSDASPPPQRKKTVVASDSSSSGSSGKSDEDGSDSESGSDDEEDWGSDSDSSSSSDEEAGAYSQLKGRARWLKKNTVVKEKVVKNKDERAKQRAEAKERAALAQATKEAVTATKSIIPEEALTPSLLDRKVKELAALRGRKGKDNRQILRQLEALSRLSLKFGPRVEIPILMQVIAAQFGLLRTMDDFMDTATWKSCASYLERITDVLEEGYSLGAETVDEAGVFLTNKGESLGTDRMKAAAQATDGAMAAFSADEKLINPHTGEAETEDERAERLRVEKEATLTDEEKKVIYVVGSLSLHLSRLEEEYTKSLQKISQHSPEYIVRLRDESKLVELLSRGQAYFQSQGSDVEAAILAQLRVEHIYYRHDSIANQVDKAARFYKQHGEVTMLHPGCIFAEKMTGQVDFSQVHPAAITGPPTVDDSPTVDYGALMTELCQYVYRHGTEQAKVRATICQIYHHALHDRFIDARDLLLMSHLQDTIYSYDDVSTMVLYNRMMANVGMCAFRVGRIYDAHQCLSEICSGRVRELLAQGIQRFHGGDKSAEQEKAEKRRQVPYHQHINLDLLEACHLISAMLIEVPSMAEAEAGSRRYLRSVSRNFRKLLDQYNHQVFTGPPEQTRDFVMSASKALMRGDWATCVELLSNLDVWQLVPGENAAKDIAAMLLGKIKLEALRTYMFAFSKQYESLSLNVLAEMFELSKNEVHSIVSKMIINRELHATWDQPTETIVLRKSDPTPLQVLALQLAEKTAHLVESNERLLDAQSGSHGFKEDWKEGEEHRWHGRGGRGGAGGGYRGHQGGGRGRGGDRGNRNTGRGFQNRSGGRGGGGRGRRN